MPYETISSYHKDQYLQSATCTKTWTLPYVLKSTLVLKGQYNCLFINTCAYATPEAGEQEKVARKNVPSIWNLKDFFNIFPQVKTKDTHCRVDPVRKPKKTQKTSTCTL